MIQLNIEGLEQIRARFARLIPETQQQVLNGLAQVAFNSAQRQADTHTQTGVLRGYVLTCLESNASAEDVFSVKLKQYQKEFDATLAQARAAMNVVALIPSLSLSIPIERG